MKVIYNHPSVPRFGIKVGVSYDLEYIKTLFKDYKKYFRPTSGEWKAEKNVVKKVSIEKEDQN